jgi:molybdopterin-guanine dinucleotide biosynthesis protein
MDRFGNSQVTWPYATHLVDRGRAKTLVPIEDGHDPGAIVLARVLSVSRHKEIELPCGCKRTLYPGDVFVGVLGDRYATDQFEALGRIRGRHGEVVAMGGVVGEVASVNSRMVAPTTIEYLGRVADSDGRPLRTQQFQRLPARSLTGRGAVTLLTVGASMNSGKTTTGAQIIRSLAVEGFRVAAAKVTGTACRKDLNLFRDAGAIDTLDFTYAGWPSTANLSRDELLEIAGRVRAALQAHDPDFVVIEIADGLVQRETKMLIEDDEFRDSIDAVTFAGPDALSCDAGVRRLKKLGGPELLATAGMVANSALGIAEAENVTDVRCLSGDMILGGALVPALCALRERVLQGTVANGDGDHHERAVRSSSSTAARRSARPTAAS